MAVLLLLVAVTVNASRGDRSQLLLLLVACAGALAAGRALGTAHPALVPAAVIAVAAAVAIGNLATLTGTGPLGGPFGYENATGAFFAQAAIACVLATVATRRAPLVVFGTAGALAFAMLAVSSSAAAAVSLGVALVALPVIVRPRWARPAVLVAGLLFVTVLAATIALGTSYREDDRAGGLEGALRSVFTERRVALCTRPWRSSRRTREGSVRVGSTTSPRGCCQTGTLDGLTMNSCSRARSSAGLA